MPNNINYWLAAAHTTITPNQFHQWLHIFPTIQSIFTATQKEWQLCGMLPAQMQMLRSPDWRQVEKSLQWSQREGCHILTLDDSDYPQLLKEISDPPLVLFVRGDVPLLKERQIAIVGAREITQYGEKHAQAFAAALVR